MAKKTEREIYQPKLAAKDREAFLDALFKPAPPKEKPKKSARGKKPKDTN